LPATGESAAAEQPDAFHRRSCAIPRHGLITTEKSGRVRRCSLGPRDLTDIQRWIEGYQRMLDERLDRFGELLERTKGEKP